MKYLFAAPALLQPYLEKLMHCCPHRSKITYLPDAPAKSRAFLRELAEKGRGWDALYLLGGADSLPEEGLTAKKIPLVIPRVHNLVALLLGSAGAYRRLYRAFDGEVCWMLPQHVQPLFPTPREDCASLCFLADMDLGLWDTSLEARSLARSEEWDFFEQGADLSLLTRLLQGSCTKEEVLCVPAGQTVYRSHDRELVALG